MNLSLSSVFRIIGIVLVIVGISMVPSFVVSLIYDDASVCVPFLITILSAVAVGALLMWKCNRHTKQLKVRDGFLIVTVCWFISAALGAVPFVVTGSIPNPVDAFFESCSGFSTTGSTILPDVEILPKGILFWRSFTHWIGGMGILIFAIALMPSLGISGQNIAVSEAPGPSLDKTSPKMTDTAKGLYTIYLIFTVAETIMLMLGGMSLYDSLIHTFGSVGTGGLSNYNDSVGHFNSDYISLVITLFMIMCGVNFNLYHSFKKNGFRALWEDAEFRFYMFITFGSAAFIMAVLRLSGTYTSTKDAAVDSIFQTSTILTTTGYATADYDTWPTVCKMVLFALMIVGGCSSSTSGGLKDIRILIVLKLIKRGISTRLHPNVVENIKINGQNVSSEIVTTVTSQVFLYIVMVFIGAFIISFENVSLITCFSSVITCLGNVGPGFDLVGPSRNFSELSDLSTFVLSVYMIAGRLELYTLFIVITPRFWNPDR